MGSSDIQIGDTVRVIEDDLFTKTSFIGKTGTVVDTDMLGRYGIDFNEQIGEYTWRLGFDILPNETGRYYCRHNIEKCNDYTVQLI